MSTHRRICGAVLRTVWIGIFGISILIPAAPARAQEVPRMSKEQVREIMGNPGVAVIDVRTEAQWKAAKAKVEGADRQNPMDFAANRYSKNQILVLYCA